MANDLRKQDPEAEAHSSVSSEDRGSSALLALSAEWARLAAQAPIERRRVETQQPIGVKDAR